MAEWPAVFEERGEPSLATWNKSYTESEAEVENDDDQIYTQNGEEEEEEDQADRGEEGNEVWEFMRGGQVRVGCLPQADIVADFCADASLASLQSGNRKAAIKKNAWLDERSCDGARSDPGPLTPLGLYHKLKKPRFRLSKANQASASINAGETQQEEPDAERQGIFVTDLDPCTILALIRTASKNQVPHLQAALYGHLAFQPFFGLDISPDGLSMFRLAFHLPYRALRISKRARNDSRRSNGDPLRQVQDISFLDWEDSETSTFLYDAQISCVVAGSDEWRWIAYLFIDTYFEHEKRRETVSSYYKDDPPGVRQDPFTGGMTMADGKFQNPREFFLTVLRYRLEQVKNEWVQVVQKLKESNPKYRQIFLSRSRRQSSSKARGSVVKAKSLSKTLLVSLSKTIEFCERFCRQPAVDFRSVSESTDPRPLLSPIRTILEELESLKTTLESVDNNWDDFTRDVEVGLNSEGNRIGQFSVSLVLLISPIVLAANILSMDPKIIPFIPRDFRSFFFMILVFGALGAVTPLVRSDPFLLQPDCLISATQTLRHNKSAAPNLKLTWIPRPSAFWKSTRTDRRDEESRGPPEDESSLH